MNAPASELHNLDFVAPVPRDHFVLVGTMQHGDTRGVFVLDQTAGVLYADATLWGPLGYRLGGVTDPLATLAAYGWQPVKQATGRVLGAMISTKNTGESNHAETRLFVEPLPPAAPYR